MCGRGFCGSQVWRPSWRSSRRDDTPHRAGPGGDDRAGQNPFNTDAAIKAAAERHARRPRSRTGPHPRPRGAILTRAATGYWRAIPLERPKNWPTSRSIPKRKRLRSSTAHRVRRGSRSANRSLPLERIRDGRVAGWSQAEPAHVADCRSAGWTSAALDACGAAAAGCGRRAAKARNPAAGIRTFGNGDARCILGLYGAPLVRRGEPGPTQLRPRPASAPSRSRSDARLHGDHAANQ